MRAWIQFHVSYITLAVQLKNLPSNFKFKSEYLA